MKKISIMLLAALMLFAFVACEDKGGDPATTLSLSAPAGTKAVFGETVADFVTIDEATNKFAVTEGAVDATLKKITTEFASGIGTPAVKTGYFLPLAYNVTLTDSATVTVTYGTEADDKLVADIDDTNDVLLIAVDDGTTVNQAAVTAMTAVKVEIKDGDTTYTQTLNFKDVTLASAE